MLYRSQSDENLVMLTLAGEQRAYEALVERHQKAVIASAMRVARSRFMAEDAAQDAFVTAWMKLDDLLEKDKYCAWVCRIAKNCALNIQTQILFESCRGLLFVFANKKLSLMSKLTYEKLGISAIFSFCSAALLPRIVLLLIQISV